MRLKSDTPFTVLSPLTVGQAAERLSGAVASPGIGRRYRDLRPFVGHVGGSQFDVMMSSRGRNSFRPHIRGSMESAGRGTRVTGTIAPNRGVLLFLLLFVSMPASMSTGALMSSVRSGRWELELLVVPAVLLLFIVAVVLAFAWETRRALRAIAALLDGESVTHPH